MCTAGDMAQTDTRQDLIHFLEQHAFQPVLRARAQDFPEKQRGELAGLQDRTKTEVARFHGYRSAQEVVTNFKRDPTSAPAKQCIARLVALGLPTLDDVREQFEQLAAKHRL